MLPPARGLLPDVTPRARPARTSAAIAPVAPGRGPSEGASAYQWPGFRVETGAGGVASDRVEFSRAEHYVAVNVAPAALHLSVRGPHGFRPLVMPPRSAWVLPGGSTAVHDAHAGCAYAAVSLDPAYFARALGRARGEPTDDAADGPELRVAYAIESAPLAHLVVGLAEEAARGALGGLVFAEALALGVALEVARAAGVEPAAPPRARGRLSGGARRRVLERIDTGLKRGAPAAALSIEVLAREAALGPSYFRRAFLETFGVPPHQYVLRERLARARRLLDAPGASPSGVAQATGFADQSHFTRQFRRAFGLTPGAVVRARR